MVNNDCSEFLILKSSILRGNGKPRSCLRNTRDSHGSLIPCAYVWITRRCVSHRSWIIRTSRSKQHGLRHNVSIISRVVQRFRKWFRV